MLSFVPQKGFTTIMARKADLIKQATDFGVPLTGKETIAELETLIDGAGSPADVEALAVVSEKADVENASGKPAAKAGKRSEKALREAEELAVKEARKEAGDTVQTDEAGNAIVAPRGPKPVTRPRIERRGKGYKTSAEKIETGKVYQLADALQLVTETSTAKFDASVEIHVRLGVDPRQADQNIRATVNLPNGSGKKIVVAVFAPESEHAAATAAGADIVGDEEFVKQLDAGTLNFDTLIATPQYMPKLGKYARVLGPRGLMPNPKAGTVSTDVSKAVKDAKAGKVEYRVDKQAIVHLGIGKVSFGADKLAANAKAFFDSLQSQKPTTLKGSYVKTTNISTTMGPGIKVENVVN